MVKDRDTGVQTDLKRVVAVNVFSGKAEDGLQGRNPRIDRQTDILVDMMAHLYAFMDPGERISTMAAAHELKQQMGGEYRATLRRAGFSQLARAVALLEEEFSVEPSGQYLRRNG